jgi:hypothetical protein
MRFDIGFIVLYDLVRVEVSFTLRTFQQKHVWTVGFYRFTWLV